MNCRALKIMLTSALCIGALATSALAQFNVSIDIGQPPPPPRYVEVHEVRPGYVLIPGFWFWDGHQHRWQEHHWVEDRPGHRWVPARWERRGERHHFEPGRWEPDHRNGNGNRNREDRREDNDRERHGGQREGHDRR